MKNYYVQFDKSKLVGYEVKAKDKKEAELKALDLAMNANDEDGGSGFILFNIETI